MNALATCSILRKAFFRSLINGMCYLDRLSPIAPVSFIRNVMLPTTLSKAHDISDVS